MKSEKHRQGLIHAYQMAGTGYLAYRLERIFRKIENEQDRILHNDMIEELDCIVAEPTTFLRMLAAGIMAPKGLSKEKRELLNMAANNVFMAANLRGETNG